MNNKVLAFENLNVVEFGNLNRDKTIFILSVSLLEEHGPHLPFGVDVFVAEHMAAKLIEAISKKYTGYTIIKFPPLHVGSGGIRWLGTINSKQRTVRKIVIDYCSHLGKHGFKYVLLSNGHGGLGHVVALEEAARICSRKYNMSVISPSGKVAFNFLTGKYNSEIEEHLGYKFTDEEKKQLEFDSHAGWWETSIMMVINPQLVEENYKTLKPFVLTRSQRMINKVYPGDQGYRGYPAKATPEYAEAVTSAMIDHTMDLIGDWLKGEKMTEKASSPLYKMLFFRTNFDRTIIVGLLTVIIVVLYFIFRI
jgi:creatinine amidohydrolase